MQNEWQSEFPKVTQLTTITRMKSHPDYIAAKSGDITAAYKLMRGLLGNSQQKKIKALGRLYPDAILTGVYAEESTGKNKIPHALVSAISEFTGIEDDYGIVQVNRTCHTGNDMTFRLAYRPKFTGTVQAGRDYIIVDDVVTSGATLGELRCYIESMGGKVVHMIVVAAAKFGTHIAVSQKTNFELESTYGIMPLQLFLRENRIYDGAYQYLTEAEARSILAAGSIDAAGDRIAEARRRGRGEKLHELWKENPINQKQDN